MMILFPVLVPEITIRAGESSKRLLSGRSGNRPSSQDDGPQKIPAGVAYGFIGSGDFAEDFADNIKSLGLGFVGSLAAYGDGFGKGWEFPRK